MRIFTAFFVSFLVFSSIHCRPESHDATGPPEDPEDLLATFIAGPDIPVLAGDAASVIDSSWPAVPGVAVELSWRDTSNSEEGFIVERREESGGDWQEIGYLPSNIAVCPDREVTPGLTYSYRVYAYNRYGRSGHSNLASATVIGSCPECLAGGIRALEEHRPEIARGYFRLVGPDASGYESARYGEMLAGFQLLAGQVGKMLNTIPGLLESGSNYEGYGLLPDQEEMTGSGSTLWILNLVTRMLMALDVFSDNWELYSGLLGIDLVREYVGEVRELAMEAVERGGTLQMEYFPLRIGSPGDELRVALETVKNRQGEVTARLVWFLADAATAVLDYLSAYRFAGDFAGDLGLLGGLREELEGDDSDILGIIRGLGQWKAVNPFFLARDPVRRQEYMRELTGTVWDEGADNLKALGDSLVSTARPADSECTDAVCLVDADGSGTVSEGDRVRIPGSLRVEMGPGFFQLISKPLDSETVAEIEKLADLFAPTGITVSAGIDQVSAEVDLQGGGFLVTTQMMVGGITRFQGSGGTLIDRMIDSIRGGSTVSSDELKPVLEELGLPELPGAIRINLQNLADMPIGGLFTYYCEDISHTVVDCITGMPAGGTATVEGLFPVLPVEVEMVNVEEQCGEAKARCGSPPYPPYYQQGDRSHFAGTRYEIPADTISPVTATVDGAGPADRLLYFAPADPTFNGSLEMDLSQLPEICSPEGEAGFVPADIYSLNKLLNCLRVDYVPRAATSPAYFEAATWVRPFRGLMDFLR